MNKFKEDITKMARAKQSMDGNTAAAHVAYAYTEVAGIYPITPSSRWLIPLISGQQQDRRTFLAAK